MNDNRNTREGADTRVNLLNMLPADAEQTLRGFAIEHGEKPFRGSQVVRHLWQSPVDSFADMTDLPLSFRGLLAEHFTMPRLALATRQTSIDGTEKFLFRLHEVGTVIGGSAIQCRIQAFGDARTERIHRRIVHRDDGDAVVIRIGDQ